MTFCKYEVIARGTCFSMFVYIHAHFHFVLIGRNLTAQSIGSHKGIECGIQIPETQLPALLPFPTPPPEHPREFARRLLRARVRNQLEDSDLGHIYVGKRRVLRLSHCTTLKLPPPFSPYVFQSLNHDLPKASCPKQQFYESSAEAQYFTLAAQLVSKPQPPVHMYLNIFQSANFSLWIQKFQNEFACSHESNTYLYPLQYPELLWEYWQQSMHCEVCKICIQDYGRINPEINEKCEDQG